MSNPGQWKPVIDEQLTHNVQQSRVWKQAPADQGSFHGMRATDTAELLVLGDEFSCAAPLNVLEVSWGWK